MVSLILPLPSLPSSSSPTGLSSTPPSEASSSSGPQLLPLPATLSPGSLHSQLLPVTQTSAWTPLLRAAPHDLSLRCSPFHLGLPGGIFSYWLLYCLPLAELEHQLQGNKSLISPSHCCVPAPGQVSGLGGCSAFVVRDATVLVGRRLLVTSFCLSLCTQAAKGGTVKAASGFSAAEDAQTLRKAMKGLGKCPLAVNIPCVSHIPESPRGRCVHKQMYVSL